MNEKIRLEECTDAELVARCLTGEREAFDALAVRYLGAMHAAALARLREREAAEEAVQEALLRAYLNISDLKNPSKAGPWMTTIARNMAINWLNSGKRRSDVLRLVPLSEVEHALADTAEKGAREKMEAQETRSCLEAALDSLEDEERELVLLHYAEGLNNNEISQQIGVHPTTVGRRLDRAFARMRSDLEPVLREEGRKMRPSKKFQARTLLVISAAAALSAETKSAIAATGGTVAVTQASAAMAAIGTGAAFATDAAVKGSILMTLKAKIVALVAAVGLLGGVGYVAQESAEPPVKKMQANADGANSYWDKSPPETDIPTTATVVAATFFSMAAALEAYYLDNNQYPMHGVGDKGLNKQLDPANPAYQLPTFKLLPDGPRPQNFSAEYMTLTTPVTYFYALPYDPYVDGMKGYSVYYNADNKGWILISPGPDGDYDIQPEKDFDVDDPKMGEKLEALRFDPKNGPESNGDIFLFKVRD